MADKRIFDKQVESLFQAILVLKNIEELYIFFEDIATVSELKSLAQRLEVAKQLDRGFNYNDIAKSTGASSATISRVRKCLDYGADGYKLALSRLKH